MYPSVWLIWVREGARLALCIIAQLRQCTCFAQFRAVIHCWQSEPAAQALNVVQLCATLLSHIHCIWMHRVHVSWLFRSDQFLINDMFDAASWPWVYKLLALEELGIAHVGHHDSC